MKRTGKGMACMWYPIGFTVMANPSAATVKVNTDGTATLLLKHIRKPTVTFEIPP
jgi:CO/xanthine dehydrogenase Mo-binding subunit